MKKWNGLAGALLLTVFCLLLFFRLGSGQQPAAGPTYPQEMQESAPVVMIALPWDDPTIRIRPPAQFRPGLAPTSSFSINYLAAGTPDGQGATCLAWNSSAQTAFSYTASIWASVVNSSVPIRINACWAALSSPTTLGYSWSNLLKDFTGAPRSGTWYSSSLADALAGSDIDSSKPDFYITYNTNFSWYLGTDGNTPAGVYDFVSVVLHEMGHGLNFSGTMRYGTSCGNATYGCWGYGTGYPGSYDRFIENTAGTAVLNTTTFPNASAALGSALISNGLYFNGTNANAANGGNRVKIYAPATWTQGSSFAHLDYTTFSGTANRLMVYAINTASSIHSPGAVTMGLLKDLGWGVNSTPVVQKKLYLPAVRKDGSVVTPGWETVVSTDFEGAWPNPWTLFDNNGTADGEYLWGKRTCKSFAGSYSGWGVGAGANGAVLNCGSNYPDNADAWMVYGPFSLAGATAADLKFKLWLNSEANYDSVKRLASTNGSSFYGYGTSGNTGGWVDKTLDLASVPTLGDLRGQANVWVALVFYSDSTTNLAEGGYVDNIVLRRCPAGATCPAGTSPALSGDQSVEYPVTLKLPKR